MEATLRSLGGALTLEESLALGRGPALRQMIPSSAFSIGARIPSIASLATAHANRRRLEVVGEGIEGMMGLF